MFSAQVEAANLNKSKSISGLPALANSFSIYWLTN